MAGYLMAVPLLLWFAGMAMSRQAQGICNRLITGFNVLVFAVFVFTFGANVFLYQEWHTLLNNRALEYFRTPAALLDSMSFGFKSGSVAAYLFFTWIFWLIYRRLVGVELFSGKNQNLEYRLAAGTCIAVVFGYSGQPGRYADQ